MSNNTDLSDDELIQLMQIGNSKAQFEFYYRYEYNSFVLAKKFYHYPNSGVTLQEFQAVCLANVYIALNKYIVGKNTFYSYWETIAKNACIEYLNENSYYGKARNFSGAISLDDTPDEEIENSQKLGTPDSDIYNNIARNELTHLIKNEKVGLTDNERVFLTLYLTGMDVQECGKVMKIKKTYAYQVYNGAINKLREYMNKRVFIKK